MIFDIHIRIDESLEVITISGAEYYKGDKGDDFTYEDFTPEQLEGLKVKGDNGASAYDVAVELGFVGTQAEWVASLKGDKGDKGDKGYNGWTPTTEFETYGTKQLKKLTRYIGGTGDAPTDNIGLYFAEGGFTADKDLATDFRGTDGIDGVDGETVVNVNASSTITTAKVWIGTRVQYDAQIPLADDVLIFILK
jgi:hypothetical protein